MRIVVELMRLTENGLQAEHQNGRLLIEIETTSIHRSAANDVYAAAQALLSRDLRRVRRRDVRSDDADRRLSGWRRLYPTLRGWIGRGSGQSLPSERCVRVPR